MNDSFKKMRAGYQAFRQKYAKGEQSVMQQLAEHGQKPDTMVIACSDSRVDPSVILQADPGELFIVRNVANIVPPYESDDDHYSVSAALEFAVCYLQVKHVILLGHSQCGGINALLHGDQLKQDDFISQWVSVIDTDTAGCDVDAAAKRALTGSYQNCLTFPWIKARVDDQQLDIHRWFFDLSSGQVLVYSSDDAQYHPLS